jgi:hypothetical protein
LIIDEAQRLNPQLLEQIRLLSNIEKRGVKLLSIFLVGQDELQENLLEEKNRALRQRIAVHYHIEPLTEAETLGYINHRLQVAGPQKEIFNPEAISEIFQFSKGCPRLINTICDRALLTGYAAGISQIDRKIVQKCADELVLPGEREYAPETTQEKPDTEVREEDNLKSAAGEPEAVASEFALFAREHVAKLKALIANINNQELLFRIKLTPRIIIASLAVLILTAIALYLWLA